jgi:hypothetical protein
MKNNINLKFVPAILFCDKNGTSTLNYRIESKKLEFGYTIKIQFRPLKQKYRFLSLNIKYVGYKGKLQIDLMQDQLMLKCTFVQDQLNLCSATQISPKVPESALRQVMVLRQKKNVNHVFGIV